jgi:hypothetical protein
MFPLLLPIFSTLIDRLVPDTNEATKVKADMELRLMEAANAANLAQIDANKVEAANASVFVAGWRPFIGWVCGGALAFQYVVTPVAIWTLDLMGKDVPAPPALDDMLWQLMLGMLGMGGLRSWEKIKGVSK